MRQKNHRVLTSAATLEHYELSHHPTYHAGAAGVNFHLLAVAAAVAMEPLETAAAAAVAIEPSETSAAAAVAIEPSETAAAATVAMKPSKAAAAAIEPSETAAQA